MNLRYLWTIPLALLWPAIQLLVFVARFGDWPPDGPGEALVFLPMGLVSALVLLWLLGRTQSRPRKISTAVGYCLVSPLAFVSSLLSGLVLASWLGPLIYGGAPLIVGTLLGYAAGTRWDR